MSDDQTGSTTTSESTSTDTGTEQTATGAEQPFTPEYVSGLRDESAGYLTQRDEARDQLTSITGERDQLRGQLDTLLQGLGQLTGNSSGEETPEQVIARLTQERDENAQAAAANETRIHDLMVRDAINTAAGNHSGDPAMLRDSTDLRATINKLDHTADDYAAQVDAAVLAAITANPKYKAGPALPGASTGDPNNAMTEQKLTIDDVRKMSGEERLKAAKDGRLKHLLGGA